MSLAAKLARWQQAGVIDAATAGRIKAFEQQGRRPVVLYAMAALGAGTIALGLVSIVAANWDAIGGNVKLGCDLALGAALAFGTYYAASRRLALATEVLVTVFYGFTLASLALVGQVYQLETPTYQALVVWSAATLPLVLLGHGRYLGGLVVCGLATTHGYVLQALTDYIERAAGFDGATERNLLATVFYASALLYVLLGKVPWLLRERREYAATLQDAGWLAVLAGGFGVPFIWYEAIDASGTLSWALLSTALLSAAFAFVLVRGTSSLPPRGKLGLCLVIGFAWLSLAVGTSFARPSASFVGAILQVVWLGLCAFTVVQLGMLRAFNLLTALLGLRVLVVYFEVFGSLLDTGLGLISGGALTLLMAWLWRNKTRDLAERLTATPEGAGHVS